MSIACPRNYAQNHAVASLIRLEPVRSVLVDENIWNDPFVIKVIRKRPKFWFGSVRGSADFGRFGSVRFGKNFAELLPNFLSFNFMLTYNIRRFTKNKKFGCVGRGDLTSLFFSKVAK